MPVAIGLVDNDRFALAALRGFMEARCAGARDNNAWICHATIPLTDDMADVEK